MFEKYLINQNPHWHGKKIETGFIREETLLLEKLLSTRQILALLGVRRAGKSTVAKQLMNYLMAEKKISPKNIIFLNLEDPFLYAHKNDPVNLEKIYNEYEALIEPRGKVFVFLDEAQFFTGWQIFVKSRYERGNIKFVITGSNSKLLSAEMATVLSGRSITSQIYPFSFQEFLEIRGVDYNSKIALSSNESKIIKAFNNFLEYGGFPEVILEKEELIKKEILINYYRSILFQDIIPRFEIKKTKEIENLLLYLFSNVGQSYSYSALGKIFGLQDKTIKEYLSFFNQAFLLHEVANFQYSLKKQENYPKKSYAIDTGFVKVISFQFSENYGWILENAVFNWLLSRGDKIYYYRDKLECDFVVKRGIKIIEAVQVTKVLDFKNEKREINGLLEAMDKFNLKEGFILTENQEEKRIVNKKIINIIPVWKKIVSKE
jgi:hypothetical protein